MKGSELVLDGIFAAAWSGRDPFAEVKKLRGEVYRQQGERRTLRFDFAGQRYFLKRHGGVSWREIFKNLAVLKLPVVSARNEWRALARLRELGIDSLEAVAYGRKSGLPASLESFLITRDLGRVTSLEDICATWPQSPPDPTVKRALIRRVADMARRLHAGGVCHRDFYICHFLLGQDAPQRLYLIDLHRALISPRLGRRWIVKDVGSLYFSAMDIGLTRRDRLRFVAAYSGKDWRHALREDAGFWRDVEGRGEALRRRHG